MHCPKCEFEQPATRAECARCGVIFAKIPTHSARSPQPAAEDDLNAGFTRLTFFREIFLHVKPDTPPFFLLGRILLYIALLVWGWKFILSPLESNYVGRSWMHLVNLPFHEAGHLLFRPFGQLMMMMGGSLGQLLMPLVCLGVLLLKTRDPFGASVALWWLGESLMDLAPYINDARDLKLMLLGGVTGRDAVDYHDWEFILRKLGMLEWDHFLAQTAQLMGILLMILSFVWGGAVLYRHFRAAKQ